MSSVLLLIHVEFFLLMLTFSLSDAFQLKITSFNNLRFRASDKNSNKATYLESVDAKLKEIDDITSDLIKKIPINGELMDEEIRYIENPFYLDDNKPNSAFILAINNFCKQGSALLGQFFTEKLGITGKSYVPLDKRPPNCLGLTLDDEAVKKAEEKREARSTAKVESNIAARALYDIGCFALDELFEARPIARFWFLETIARIPYFSYVSMLHLYESLGWWRGNELRKVHNAEEDNEFHHLLIMEALGGNALWTDRFLGYHVAIGYYWALIALYFFSPRAAYGFMALLEAHAVDTYGTFLKENKERLKLLPAPKVAESYYLSADLYLFDEFQVTRKVGTRRPPCDNLYDVFKNIMEDEVEHVKTMIACQDYARGGSIIVSPHLKNMSHENDNNNDEKRQNWKVWAESINEIQETED